jgi:chromosome segregation ATPase
VSKSTLLPIAAISDIQNWFFSHYHPCLAYKPPYVITFVSKRNDVDISSLDLNLVEDFESHPLASTKESSEISRRVEIAEAETSSLLKERDDLLAATETLKQQVETLQKNDSDYRTLIKDLQSQLVESNLGLSKISKRIDSAEAEKILLVKEAEAETSSLLKERDDLLAVTETLKQQVETLQKNDSDYRTLIENLQSQLVESNLGLSKISKCIDSAEAEKILLLKEKDDLLAEIDATKEQVETIQISETSIHELQAQMAEKKKECEYLFAELHNTKVMASKERAEFKIRIASLETDLLRSKNEEKRLVSAMAEITNSHANTMARLEDITNGLVNQKDLLNQISEMEQRMHLRTYEVEQLNTQLIESKTLAREESRRLKTIIAIHESDLLESRQNADNLRSELKAVLKTLDETTSKMYTLMTEQETMRKEIMTLNSSVDGTGKEDDSVSHRGNEMLGDFSTENDDMMSAREPHAARAVSTLNNLRELTETSSSMHIIEEMKINFRSLQCERDELRTAINGKNVAISEWKGRVQDISARNELLSREVESAREKCTSLTAELHDARKTASSEQDILSSEIATKEENLVRSTQEVERLTSDMKLLESNHAQTVARLESDKKDLIDMTQDTTQKIESLKKSLNSADFEARWLEEKLSSKILSLEEKLREASIEEERLSGVVKSLECSHAEAVKALEDNKTDLESRLHTLTETSATMEEQLGSKIALIEAELLQALIEEERLGGVVKSLTEASATEQAQLRSAIASLDVDLLHVLRYLNSQEGEKNTQHQQHTPAETPAETSAAKQQQQGLRESVLALELTVKSLAEKAKERSEEIRSLIQQVGDAEVRFNVSEAGKRELEVRIEDAASEIADGKMQYGILSDRFATVKSEKDAALARIEELTAELLVSASTLSDVQQLIFADQKQLSDMRDKIKALEIEKKQEQDALQLMIRDKDDTFRKLEFSRQEADEFRCKIESSKSLAESITKVQSMLESSEKEVDYLKKKIAYSERMAERMEKECETLTRSIDELNVKRNEENQRNIQRYKRQQKANQCEIACLENIITSLKKEYEAFKVESRAVKDAQLKSCKAKLESICATDWNGTLQLQDRTFDDVTIILEQELSHLRGELKLALKKLDHVHGEKSSLENIVTSLKQEYKAFKLKARSELDAQIRSCEAKLAPFCSRGGKGAPLMQSLPFDDMITIIQDEFSSLSLMTKNLEEVQNESAILEHQVRILSSEVSKYKLQNKGMLQALDELTIGMGDSYEYPS